MYILIFWRIIIIIIIITIIIIVVIIFIISGGFLKFNPVILPNIFAQSRNP